MSMIPMFLLGEGADMRYDRRMNMHDYDREPMDYERTNHETAEDYNRMTMNRRGQEASRENGWNNMYNDHMSYNTYLPYYPDMTTHRDYQNTYQDPMGYDHRRYGNGRFAPRERGNYVRNSMHGDDMEDDDMRSHEQQMGRIGFVEGGRKHEELTRAKADEWVKGMHNEDGSKGAHWDFEQTKKVAQQNNIMCDPLEFYVAVNMMYSDYYKVAKEFNLDSPAFYAKLARAFLEDKDSGPYKLENYFEEVVK